MAGLSSPLGGFAQGCSSAIFNTGNNDLGKDPKGSRITGPEMPGRLSDTGYVDAPRLLRETDHAALIVSLAPE